MLVFLALYFFMFLRAPVLLFSDEHSSSADFGGGFFSSSCFQLCGQHISADIMVTNILKLFFTDHLMCS